MFSYRVAQSNLLKIIVATFSFNFSHGSIGAVDTYGWKSCIKKVTSVFGAWPLLCSLINGLSLSVDISTMGVNGLEIISIKLGISMCIFLMRYPLGLRDFLLRKGKTAKTALDSLTERQGRWVLSASSWNWLDWERNTQGVICPVRVPFLVVYLE